MWFKINRKLLRKCLKYFLLFTTLISLWTLSRYFASLPTSSFKIWKDVREGEDIKLNIFHFYHLLFIENFFIWFLNNLYFIFLVQVQNIHNQNILYPSTIHRIYCCDFRDKYGLRVWLFMDTGLLSSRGL